MKKIYETMEQKVSAVRLRLGRPLTLADKILFGHLDDPQGQELIRGKSYLALRPDRVVFQDVLGQTGMLQFMQTGRDRVAVPTTIHCDHLIQARTEGQADLRAALAENDEVFDFLRSAAARYGAGFWGPGSGIVHQIVLENYAAPGAMIIGTDSHTPNAGGLGACAVGVGGADAVEVIAGLPWELLYPRIIGVYLSGSLSGWTAPKDVILYLAGVLGVAGATNAIIEYLGPGAQTISATGKATISNMGAELGATTSLWPVDERMLRYLRATGRVELVPAITAHAALLSADREVEADPERHYDQVLRLDLATLEPHIVGPASPDRARPISRFVTELRSPDNPYPDELSAALVGSCTNSSYEDMCRAADVARQGSAHGRKAAVTFLLTPGSERVRATTERDGQLAALRELGGVVLASACGPCIGQWQRPAALSGCKNSIVTSYNRNFPGRNDGQTQTLNFIASPEIVTALAIAGRLSFNPLTDTLIGSDGQPFHLEPPAPAPDVPAASFERGDALYLPPPAPDAGGARVVVPLRPDSQRLQRLEPWPAWDGQDLLALPVLIKTRGKTTTDQISPAGIWLRYRGHLDRFSDNLLSGAVNAWTGAIGVTTNLLTGAEQRPIAEVARDYRAHGRRWVIIGDHNYGEGSSREHAALSPRLLHGAAVIARSFARIHESNLKKQGLLALTFRDPADYERILPGDALSLIGLSALAPGKEVVCLIQHADRVTETLQLRHSYSASQLQWFRAGSALNATRSAGTAPAVR